MTLLTTVSLKENEIDGSVCRVNATCLELYKVNIIFNLLVSSRYSVIISSFVKDISVTVRITIIINMTITENLKIVHIFFYYITVFFDFFSSKAHHWFVRISLTATYSSGSQSFCYDDPHIYFLVGMRPPLRKKKCMA